MAFKQIYNDINEMKNINHDDMYVNLIDKYDKEFVDHVMYNLFQYEYIESDRIKERPIRNDNDYKKAIEERYGSACVITGINYPYEICHIKPFTDCNEDEKYNINNGLILDRNLHKMFDDGIVKINPDTLLVEIGDKIMKDPKQKYYKSFNGFKVNINTNSIPYLQYIYNLKKI